MSDWECWPYHFCVEAGDNFYDMVRGTLMKLAREDATVMLISNHGFHPDVFRLDQVPREQALAVSDETVVHQPAEILPELRIQSSRHGKKVNAPTLHSARSC